MATKSISQLDTQATANETDLFEVAIVDQNSASGYASKKESAAAIADAIVGEYQYPLRITGTTAKTIAGAINELKNLVDLLPQFAIEVVNTLPVSDISETTIYLVPASDPEQGNYYEEYIYVNNAWELVGTTAVDLSGYYTSAQVDTLLAAKANTSSLATVATSGAYSDLSGKPTIDTALDTTSTNAVENRAVAGAIEEIESELSSPDTSDNEPYLLRDSASGTADRMVDELVGGTIAWNQLIGNGNFVNTNIWNVSNGALTVSDNIATLSAVNSLGNLQVNINQTLKRKLNHVYYGTAKVATDSQARTKFYFGQVNQEHQQTDSSWYTYNILNKNTNSTVNQIFQLGFEGKPNVDDVLYIKEINLFDLTQMFGSTIAD